MATLNILFCDDNTQFAFNQVETLSRKLKTKYGISPPSLFIETITHLKGIHDLIDNPASLQKYDLIFCDLGWSDLTLNGIQLLHDIQMAHPKIYTVLYTAQDEDAIISQALKWQLDFIDVVIKIDGNDYFNEMLDVIRSRFQRKVDEMTSGVSDGKRVKLGDHYLNRLIETRQQFPRLDKSDLVALEKSSYIEFVKKKYGGFPQMASQRGLDLNNIYRVNRRFKGASFVVFQYDTIQEIVGIYDKEESDRIIATLLAAEESIGKVVKS